MIQKRLLDLHTLSPQAGHSFNTLFKKNVTHTCDKLTRDLSTRELFQSTCYSHMNFSVYLIKRKISCSPLAEGSSRESNAVHSSGPHFVLRELSLLKPTVPSRFAHPRAHSNYATPANQLSATASGSGNNTTFVRSPRVPSPRRTLMKTDRKWGWKTQAGNDHI